MDKADKDIKTLKQEYVDYYKDVPVQKYAAMAVGRDEDTIMRWRGADQDFADAVKRAKAEWVRKKMLAVKAEFALERLEKDVFTPKEELVVEQPMPRAGTGTTFELNKAFKQFIKDQIRNGNYHSSTRVAGHPGIQQALHTSDGTSSTVHR